MYLKGCELGEAIMPDFWVGLMIVLIFLIQLRVHRRVRLKRRLGDPCKTLNFIQA